MTKKPSRIPGTTMPQIAPYHSCVTCGKGDTTTGFALIGEYEWVVAALLTRAGIPEFDADAICLSYVHHELGCDYGKVPVDEFTLSVRLCADCAQKNNTEVARPGPHGELPGYSEAAWKAANPGWEQS